MTVPKVWAFKNPVPAAELNKVGTSLTEAHGLLGDAGAVPLCYERSEAVFYAVHTHRFLHFGSSGSVQDVAGVGEDVSISEGDNHHGVHDLDSIAWLGYGMLYRIVGVSACIEHWEP